MSRDFHLCYRTDLTAALSPYRVLDDRYQEIRWINRFLDAQQLRGLSPRSLRAYGYDLLNFIRWWWQRSHPSLARLDENRSLDYVRFQLAADPKPTPQTVNHRLAVLRCLYRFHCQHDIPRKRGSVLSIHKTRDPLGFGKPGRVWVPLRLKQPQRVVIPLSRQEVSRFWSSFRSFRDLAILGLMLLNGLRSREVLELQLQDLRLSEYQIRVRGKGNKERILPLCDDTIRAIERYRELERPVSDSPLSFLSLKGRRRGQPMTPAGFHSLFRHHRRLSGVRLANPPASGTMPGSGLCRVELAAERGRRMNTGPRDACCYPNSA
ncbi:MAG: tyrosine-type recombinase/integrase [Acidobacteria bacterium]|nr:tyrosine-type recombinase/integrase [Acidobacteriota bacterium]